MKKILSILLCVTMLAAPVTAARCEDDIKVLLDGQEIEFDVPPRIIDGRTLVPVRAIFEALGAKVDWRESYQSIIAYRDGTEIIMPVGGNTIKKHAWPHSDYSSLDTIIEWKSYESGSIYTELDVPPMIIDDRALVPIRAVSESFDCTVSWEQETQTVNITSKQEEILPAPTIEPEEAEPETEAASDIPIEYDDTNERLAHYMRDFEILTCDKNDNGDYVITYKLRTFLEGKGAVSVEFTCLDGDGRQTDSFGGGFVGTDYTWSWHESSAVISGKTKTIELILKD